VGRAPSASAAALLFLVATACGAPPSSRKPRPESRGPSREARVPSGRLDLGFGTVELTAKVRPGPISAAAVAVDAHGRTLALFRADPSPSDSHGVLVTLGTNGAIESAVALADPKAAKTFPYGLVVLGDRVVAYGNVQVASRYEGALWWVGTKDSKHLFYDANDAGTTEIWSVAPSPDDKLLYVSGRNGEDGFVDRFGADGSVDATWNDGMPRRIARREGEAVRVHALAPAADGTVYALAVARTDRSAREALLALDAVGNVAEISGAGLPGGASTVLSDLRGAIARQRDGKLVVARCDAHERILVQRVGAGGALDGSFASHLPPTIAPCRFGDLVLLADGTIVVGWFAEGSRTATLARLTKAGALDTAFGSAGFAAIASPSGVTTMRFATDADHLVVSWTTANDEAFVARYRN
jgi:hypothetical protein